MHPDNITDLYPRFPTFKALDRDGDGQSSWPEFRRSIYEAKFEWAIAQSQMNLKISEKDTLKFEKAFMRMDLDGNWNVSEQEFKKFFEATVDRKLASSHPGIETNYSSNVELYANKDLVKKYGKTRKLPKA